MTTKSGALLLALAVVGGVTFLMDDTGALPRIAEANGQLAQGPAATTTADVTDFGDWVEEDEAEQEAVPANGTDGAENRQIAIADYEAPDAEIEEPGFQQRSSGASDPGRPRVSLTSDMPNGTVDTQFDPRLP